jgi:hypothetical protein
MNDELITTNSQRIKILYQLENVIHDNMGAVHKVGEALREIRDNRLWVDNYPSFGAYCRQRWGFGARNARYIMNSETYKKHLDYEKGKRKHVSAEDPHSVDMGLFYSSEHEEHYTPADIIELVIACFGGEIDLDPCSNTGTPNVPAKVTYAREQDGLKQPWFGRVFVNPPYGNSVPLWVDKAITEYLEGRTDAIILLLAARPDTLWFHDLRNFPICFLRGRLRFLGNPDPAPFPSALFWISDQSPAVFAATLEERGTTFVRYYADGEWTGV